MNKWRSLTAAILVVVLLALPFSSAQAFFGFMRSCCGLGDWGYPGYWGYPYPGHYPYYGYYGYYGYPYYAYPH